MPSPFPGMNPYLERDVAWHDFHERFLILGAGVIGAQIRPDFIARVDDHLLGRADLSVAKTPHREGPRPEGVAILDAPARVRLTQVEPTQEAYLQIVDRASREVVTVVELLSPSNKRRSGPDRSQYLAKRAGVLGSRTNLVEIDLLRGGSPMPDEGRPDCVYSVLVSRPDERPDAGFWPIGLADRLPTIPIPLRPSRPDASLDLQALLDRVYDEAGYEHDVYDGPPQPPLSAAEAEWAAQFLPAAP
ncbi:MAG: hypothetical protein BGO49_08630 [Planctomycetales bacterium 71-10]|nr:MAG: hypothetical protein BGO49_08630 [Planctomycetales bacterium 71-10]